MNGLIKLVLWGEYSEHLGRIYFLYVINNIPNKPLSGSIHDLSPIKPLKTFVAGRLRFLACPLFLFCVTTCTSPLKALYCALARP